MESTHDKPKLKSIAYQELTGSACQYVRLIDGTVLKVVMSIIDIAKVEKPGADPEYHVMRQVTALVIPADEFEKLKPQLKQLGLFIRD